MTAISERTKKRLLAAPDDEEFSKKEASIYTGLSERTLERRLKDGDPPKPHRRDPSSKMLYWRKGELTLWRDPKKHLHAYLMQGDLITAHAQWDDPEAFIAPIEELLEMQWANVELMREALTILKAEQEAVWNEARLRVAEHERAETLAAIGALPASKPKRNGGL